MTLLTIKLNQLHGSEMKELIQQMEELIKDGVMVILHTTMLKSLNQTTILLKEILLTKRLDQMFGLLSIKLLAQLPTGDQISHQLLETLRHIREQLQFQNLLVQVTKQQLHQLMMHQYKLNSLVTQKKLMFKIQSPIKH
jgi:hypothetical protein